FVRCLFCHGPATTALYTLSLHDALPIFSRDAEAGIDTPGTLWLHRPLLEGVLRQRVLALPGLETVQGAVGGLLTSEDGRTVTGVDRKSTRLNSSHVKISYAVFCLKKKKK